MNLLPVITRELRAESRRPFTYWLRTICAAALLGACMMAVFDHQRLVAYTGRGPSTVSSMHAFSSMLFGYTNSVLFASIWILVPMLAADCISREKREGTLGLLFLTPLKSWDIVISKSLVHGLRSLALYLTMLPILGMSLLFGGIGVNDLYMAFLIDSSALLLALSAGILASSLAKSATKAMILAGSFSFILALFLMGANHIGFFYITGLAMKRPGLGQPSSYFNVPDGYGLFSWIQEVFNFNTNVFRFDYYYQSLRAVSTSTWSKIWTTSSADQIHLWFALNTLLLAVSAAVLIFTIILAARRIRRAWQEQPPSPKMEEIKKEWASPVYLAGTFRKRKRWLLDRNPISWLQQYSVLARLTKWGWCLLVVIAYSFMAQGWRNIEFSQVYLIILLLAGMAYSSVSSFHGERESGALELLLVTPLRARHIIGGRGLGIWIQFLPAFIIFLAATWYTTMHGFISSYGHMTEKGSLILYGISTYLTLPWIGLYFAFKARRLITGWLFTCLCSTFLPLFLKSVCEHFVSQPSYFSYDFSDHPFHYLWRYYLLLATFPLFQILLAFLFTFLLHRKLSNRDRIL